MRKRRQVTRRQFVSTTGAALAVPLLSQDKTGTSEASEIDLLRRIFVDPPASARPLTRWWWFGGAITPEEITRELTFMRDAGLGGVELQPVYPVAVDDPKRNIHNTPYLTDAWFDLLRHVARETSRLGLQLDLTLGSGWPYGGPFIPIELSARRLLVFRQEIEGPRRVSFGYLAGEIMEGDNILFTLAAPLLPSGAPDIVHSKIIARGEMALLGGWQAPAGKWLVALFLDSPTRMQVKRPTIGMEGYILDHFNHKALAVFLQAVGDLTLRQLESVGPQPIHSVFCDSLEVYGADWTGAMFPEFKRRRGYDLEPYLPALWEYAGTLTPHVRYDYHLTLSELTLEGFFDPLVKWSEMHKVTARIQAHGAMGDVMRAYSLAHVPEGEDNPGHDRYMVNLQHRRLASSAGHVYGKALISAETYTALRTSLFLVTLEMMKAVTDGMFLDGINQIVNHGYPSSPPQAGLPGWTFYAASVINHNNTWWRHYPYLTRYIRRVAAILRQGSAVNPVAVYLPLADVYARYGCGSLNLDEALQHHLGLGLFLALRRGGYDFDVLNDHALTEVARVDSGRLRAGTAEYRVIIVPECRLMPPESLARLTEFARSGGTLIFIGKGPDFAPGLTDQDPRTTQLQATLRDLAGNGTSIFSQDAANAVEQLRAALPPDFTIVAAGASTGAELQSARENVGFVHRRRDRAELYFVSNISETQRNLRVRFACGHRRPERWDPETGDTAKVPSFEHVRGGRGEATEVDLCLGPFESCFVVFNETAERPVITRTDIPALLAIEHVDDAVRITGRIGANGEYFLMRPDGLRHQFTASGIPDVISIPGPWKLHLGNTATFDLAQLQSWTDLPEGRAYSGWATYETTFEFQPPGGDIEWTLDLGIVHETAEVELNGLALGAAWKGTRQLSCQCAIKRGRNLLRIDVANLWIHNVVNSPPWDRKAVAATYGARWGEPDEARPRTLPPSGLLGPVRILPSKRWTVRIENLGHPRRTPPRAPTTNPAL